MTAAPAGFVGAGALVPGELRGYRRFRLTADGLLPAVHATAGPWSGAVERARCAAGQAHEVPSAGCGCGLYGWYDPADTRADSGLGNVTAVIAGHGRMVLGDHGFRAAAARVEAVALTVGCVGPAHRGAVELMLARRYPDAVVYRSRRQMLRRHPPHDVRALGVDGRASAASRYRTVALSVWVLGLVALYSVVLLPRGAVADAPAVVCGAALAGFVGWQALLVWLVTRCAPPVRPRVPARVEAATAAGVRQ